MELQAHDARNVLDPSASSPNVIGGSGNTMYWTHMYNPFGAGLYGAVSMPPVASTESYTQPVGCFDSDSPYFGASATPQVLKPSASYPMGFYPSVPPIAQASSFAPYYDRSTGADAGISNAELRI